MAHAHDHAHDHGHDHDHGDDHDHGTDGDKPPIPLAVETADAGPCEKKLTITVEAKAVEERLSHALRDLRGTVALPGFRRGHAPKKLLERRYQERIQEEVRTALMEDGVKQVVEGQKWTLMGPVEWHTPETPRALSGDAPFSFEVTVEIRPSVVLPNYASIEVKRPAATVAPEEVEAEVVKIRQERAQWVPVASGGAQAHDMVVFDATFQVGGAEVHASTGASAVLPGANEGFAKGYEWVGKLAAAKSGDTITHRGTLPPDLPNADARGKDGEIQVTVRAVKRQELPPLDAEWLKALGAPSEEALRQKLSDLLQKARDRDADAALEDQILDQILERTPIELPRRLVERETEAYLQRYEMALRGKRIEAAEIPKLLEEARQERRGQVERGIRRYLLLDEIAGREKIFVTEDDVAARLAEMAAHYEKTVPAIEAELESRGLMRDLRSQLKEEKVRAFVRGKAKVSA